MSEPTPQDVDSYFRQAAEITVEGLRAGTGGPFGATLVNGDEVVVSVGNTVLRDMDPSGHAELVAVREACAKLNTLSLAGMVMYATCEPCPMCVAVMLWAGIEKCYYASTCEDAAANGFSDMHLRHFFDGSDTSTMDLVHLTEGREESAEIWTEFRSLNG